MYKINDLVFINWKGTTLCDGVGIIKQIPIIKGSNKVYIVELKVDIIERVYDPHLQKWQSKVWGMCGSNVHIFATRLTKITRKLV